MPDILHQGASLYDTKDNPQQAILPLQTVVSDPALPTLKSTTGLISPDLSVLERMSHFPDDLYDKRPESVLVRFMRALLGDTGAGQLRMRYMVTRFEAALTSTHFYDLDGFYGALFGAARNVYEQLPMNPMSGTATPDEWDDIAARDASFRERIRALAKSLTLGATIPGIQTAAEALTGVECEVFETWKLVDATGGASVAGRTWDDLEGLFATWDDIEPGNTWDSVSGEILIGRSGTNSRYEFVVRPKKNYDDNDGSPDGIRESERQRLEDERSIQRVINKIKPAGMLLTVDNQGLALHIPTPIARIVADSNYWEVVTKVTPNPGLVTGNNDPYPLSSVPGPLPVGARVIPVPPNTNLVGDSWSYNDSITSVVGYAEVVGSQVDVTVTPGDGQITSTTNWETIQAGPTTQVDYLPIQGLSDQRALIASRSTNDAVMKAHPYAGARQVVPTHG